METDNVFFCCFFFSIYLLLLKLCKDRRLFVVVVFPLKIIFIITETTDFNVNIIISSLSIGVKPEQHISY